MNAEVLQCIYAIFQVFRSEDKRIRGQAVEIGM